MQISFSPDVEDFIRAEVSSGRYSSPQELIQRAVLSLMVVEEELDDETAAAINEGTAQIERGECMDFDTFVAEIQNRTGVKYER